MIFQVVVAPSQTTTRIALVQQLADQTLGMFHQIVTGIFHEVRKLQRTCHDLIINFLHIIRINLNERILASQ